MNCLECNTRMRTKKGDYEYVESGLKNLVLSRIEILVCPKCHETIPKIHAVKQLHRIIAEHLLEKDSLLTGEEIRFLRKQMGLRAVDLAAILGVDKVTISRWENNDKSPSSTADKALRLLYMVTQVFGFQAILDCPAKIRRKQEPERIRVKPIISSQETQDWALA
jgi:putative zinc finger/helix-turn-helix YgiT family protein